MGFGGGAWALVMVMAGWGRLCDGGFAVAVAVPLLACGVDTCNVACNDDSSGGWCGLVLGCVRGVRRDGGGGPGWRKVLGARLIGWGDLLRPRMDGARQGTLLAHPARQQGLGVVAHPLVQQGRDFATNIRCVVQARQFETLQGSNRRIVEEIPRRFSSHAGHGAPGYQLLAPYMYLVTLGRDVLHQGCGKLIFPASCYRGTVHVQRVLREFRRRGLGAK